MASRKEASSEGSYFGRRGRHGAAASVSADMRPSGAKNAFCSQRSEQSWPSDRQTVGEPNSRGQFGLKGTWGTRGCCGHCLWGLPAGPLLQ